nr:MAG: hypothetical protein E4H34_05420 [Hyphomicrobiales bacterium]
MLVPSRIVSDAALHFYRMPWEAAIWPQMIFQISAAPLHAIGFPDAANVESWALGAMLAWFAWRIIRANSLSAAWSAFWVCGLCVGIYPVVWHVTGGAHAMGDLAMAAAIVAFVERDRLLAATPPASYAALVSILLLSAASSKVSLVPVCVIMLCLSAGSVLRATPRNSARRVMLSFLTPWVVLYCPIMLWTWIHSGSPFGPMLAGVFGPSIYVESWIHQTFQLAREINRPPLYVTGYYALVGYSPLVWLGAAGAVFGAKVPHATCTVLGLLFVLQCILIYLLLPHDARFLGGIPFGLAIIFASHALPRFRNFRIHARNMAVACTLLLLPWVAMQLYYATQFFPVALGFEKRAFYERYVALFDDYIELDAILAKDSVLLTDARLSSVYAPRPIFFDPLDVPPGKSVAFISLQPDGEGTPSPIDGFRLGEVIYANPRAVGTTFRTPGRNPDIRRLQVIQLHRE